MSTEPYTWAYYHTFGRVIKQNADLINGIIQIHHKRTVYCHHYFIAIQQGMSAPILPFYYMMKPEHTLYLKRKFFIHHTNGTTFIGKRRNVNQYTILN